MIVGLLMIGGFGLLGLSVLCPFAALAAYYALQRGPPKNPPPFPGLLSFPLRLEIVIPAHNEAALIGATLTGIQSAIQNLQTHFPIQSAPQIMIHVGADACTDDTSEEARRFARVTVTEFAEKRGKWAVMKALVTESSSDWVMLVDAGTIWPENFLSDFMRRVNNGAHNVLAVAPSYRPHKASWIHRTLWRMETGLKQMEGYCGGPISLHGATVAYRTTHLKKALASLGNTQWVNDDVVIPLTLRALNPQGVILYPVGEVRDAGIEQDQLDLGRRKRLLLGNLQWVSALLPSCLRRNPVAGVVAGRRVFRMLWAYWLVMIVFGVALAFHFVVVPGIVALGVLMASSGSARQISGAALISLLVPFLIVQAAKHPMKDWK